MNTWQTLSLLAGGIGLFLFGVSSMSNGLRLAAGPALERLLAGATRTRWHALGSGMLVTAIVQSSSAVTVATIGFVNAGLLTLGGALWVLFGANVGTTMTSWIVAVAGLKLSIDALALPLIAIGSVLQLTGSQRNSAAAGQAVFGFGLLFLGISFMQESFSGLAPMVTIPSDRGVTTLLLQVGAGALLTVLMQSSSASMTVALTALQQGMLTPIGAAAVAIGANIGTTVTAVLAALQGTPNARRAAAAHVVFNMLTGATALALLPWLVDAIAALAESLQLGSDPATELAVFHTVFNATGVLLIWPLAGRLTQWLQQRFRRREEDEGRPRHLDDNVLSVPALALDALRLESERIGRMARDLLRAVLERRSPQALEDERAIAQRLLAAATAFVTRMHRDQLPAAPGSQLAGALRILRYHEAVVEQSLAAAGLLRAEALLPHAVAQAEAAFFAQARALLDALDQGESHWPPELSSAYEQLKSRLLSAAAAGQIDLPAMEQQLRACSALRRALEQAHKARRPTAGLDEPALRAAEA